MDREQLAESRKDPSRTASARRRRAGPRALRLSRAERDHLFCLAGRVPEARGRRSAHVSPGLLHVLDKLWLPAVLGAQQFEPVQT